MGDDKTPRCSRSPSQSLTTPSLNLMEQLLLAKMDRNSLIDHVDNSININNNKNLSSLAARKKTLILRANSMDSQTSASTLYSTNSADSASNRYCKCDDCLLGIVDKHQRHTPTSLTRKKMN
ncbi:uncharacterized protein LOC141527737 isoform X2 [Cotesia typhae]|uniref:uncharacterized protein LOC141527737 isoform X2 n=1 Tax=Cotesia typhae TaxID=2053667 RepID=UPI003D685225